MPVQPCPACGATTPRHLHETSYMAHVNYYVCQTCHHIWTVDEQDPSKVTHVTPLPETKKPPYRTNET